MTEPTPTASQPLSIPYPKTNLEAWRDALNFSALRTLELDAPSLEFYRMFNSSLTNLQSIGFGSIWYSNDFAQANETMLYEETALSFLSNLPKSLDSLSLEDWQDEIYVLDVISRYSDLRSLSIFDGKGHIVPYSWSDPPYKKWKRSAFNVPELEVIRESFPRLEALSLTLNRDGEWVCRSALFQSLLPALSSVPHSPAFSHWSTNFREP